MNVYCWVDKKLGDKVLSMVLEDVYGGGFL